MTLNDKHYCAIWLKHDNPRIIQVIDQRFLPDRSVIENLHSVNDVVMAIKDMHIQHAELIDAAAGYAMYLAALSAPQNNEFDRFIFDAGARLQAIMPTAVNLASVIERQLIAICHGRTYDEKITIALRTAQRIAAYHNKTI
ncbi:hypothetical protein HYY69_06725 [Candidatus Woesearchaeota archaeon]|nr:hypothetical protein [Candidatus Woesearchaeota archaeon]